MSTELEGKPSPELLPLMRMAGRLGVPARWLKERAEAGEIPGLWAGNRWLFRPDVVIPAVAAMAGATGKPKGGEQ
jgi:hypothetical protein